MPIFAPSYYQSRNQRSYLARQQRLESKKRKREDDSSAEDEEVEKPVDLDPSQTQTNLSFHTVNKKDPYHVAGHSRELPLPLPPFPHAAVKEPSKQKVPIEEELAKLNPPLYVPPTRTEDANTSLKRRHVDNITTILHQCMLKGDWTRAARAWSLLLRTEIAGRGIDVRRNGRWGIGAEILMRGATKQHSNASDEANETVQDGSSQALEEDVHDAQQSEFTDEGFKLARDYYERLILQYPHTQYTQHSINATAIYPALFNIWVYEVQDRSKRARKMLNISQPDSADDSSASIDSDESNAGKKRELHQIRTRELEEATPIANRMDELLLSPPYDTSSTLLQLRGMVALWTSDLHAELAKTTESGSDTSSGSQSTERHHDQSRRSLQKANEIFNRLKRSGTQLPQQIMDMLDGDEE